MTTNCRETKFLIKNLHIATEFHVIEVFLCIYGLNIHNRLKVALYFESTALTLTFFVSV